MTELANSMNKKQLQRFKNQELPFLILSNEDFDNQTLTKENIQHLRVTLRHKAELKIFVGNGKGNIALAQLDKKNNLEFLSSAFYIPSPKHKVHLLQTFVKKKSLELILQKATELGASSLHFFVSQHVAQTFETEHKKERMQKILETACMQSRNPHVPDLYLSNLSLSKMLEQLPQEESSFFWGNWKEEPEAENKQQEDIWQEINNYKNIYFINGPEGGWSEDEYFYLKNRFRSIVLSNNVLRAETAALVALSLLIFQVNF